MKQILWNNHPLSRLCLGTVQLGLSYGIANTKGKPTAEESGKILSAVTQSGINCFDTALAYGNSEQVLGNFFRHKDEKFYIITKISSKELLSNPAILENSLQRLKLDKIFAVLLHDSILLDNTAEFALKMGYIKEKYTDYVGVSIYTNEEFSKAVVHPLIDIIQIPFNLFDQRAISLGWIDKAKKNNKLLFIRSIFLQGLLLLDPKAADEKVSGSGILLEKIDTLAHELILTRAQLALSFVMSAAPDAVIIFGCETYDQALQNIENFEQIQNLTPDTMDTLFTLFNATPESIYLPSKWQQTNG
ncbi:MAG: aldo/keto reductase [Sulfuricurvum sp.]|jgi:aryl-alcohol dehydrogenase-like predicted oxidoreductase